MRHAQNIYSKPRKRPTCKQFQLVSYHNDTILSVAKQFFTAHQQLPHSILLSLSAAFLPFRYTSIHSICADLPSHNLFFVRHYTIPRAHHANFLWLTSAVRACFRNTANRFYPCGIKYACHVSCLRFMDHCALSSTINLQFSLCISLIKLSTTIQH